MITNFNFSSHFERIFILKSQIKTILMLQRTLVPNLTLGPFLTLSVRNGHKLKDWVLGISDEDNKVIIGVLFILNLLKVFKTMSGFPFPNIYPEF